MNSATTRPKSAIRYLKGSGQAGGLLLLGSAICFITNTTCLDLLGLPWVECALLQTMAQLSSILLWMPSSVGSAVL